MVKQYYNKTNLLIVYSDFSFDVEAYIGLTLISWCKLQIRFRLWSNMNPMCDHSYIYSCSDIVCLIDVGIYV